MKVKITLPNDGKDYTQFIRQYLVDENVTEIHFFNERILVNGLIDGELDNDGIFKVRRNNLKIFGNPTVFYTDTELPENDITLKRRFLDIRRAKNIEIHNIEYESLNSVSGNEPDRPDYRIKKESHHGIEIADSKNVLVKNTKMRWVYGDGFYIGGKNTNGVTLLNTEVDWNGRQAYAVTGGNNILVDGFVVTNSRRSGFDIESNWLPENEGALTGDVVIRNGKINSHLFPFPMGGYGVVDGLLIENVEYESGRGFGKIAGSKNAVRKNIIIRNNKRIGTLSSSGSAYWVTGVENLLIENEENKLSTMMSQITPSLENARNVIIRNNNFEGGRYIVLINTPDSEVNVFNNKQKLYFIDKTVKIDLRNIEAGKTYHIGNYSELDFSKLGTHIYTEDLNPQLFVAERPAKEEDFTEYFLHIWNGYFWQKERYELGDMPKELDGNPIDVLGEIKSIKELPEGNVRYEAYKATHTYKDPYVYEVRETDNTNKFENSYDIPFEVSDRIFREYHGTGSDIGFIPFDSGDASEIIEVTPKYPEGVPSELPEPNPDPEEPIEEPIEEGPENQKEEKKTLYKKTWFVATVIAIILILTALIIT